MASPNLEATSAPLTLASLQRKTDKSSLFGMAMTVLSGLFMAIVLLPLFAVLIYVLIKGGARLNLDLFTQLPPAAGLQGGGIANAIVGTIVLLAIASGISVPVGILAAVYLSEFSNPRTARWIRFGTNVLSGVPSIIAGIFAYGLVVIVTGTFSAIAGGVALSVLMLPTIVRTTDEALQLVSQEVRWASVGLGASDYATVLKVVIPAATSAILTGVTLAIARAAGETAPLIFTALFSFFWVQGVMEPTPSLAVLVYNFAIVPFKDQQELAWAASLILVLLVLLTSILSRLATRGR
ncbi:phosphate ABC transporter, permease protein PstA [Rubidibacter lacunae KORDI 51-2]|uniref:Phosphate transport system permease protein PstA n=2 Tax=Rubidibacter TaxID=582491 RepID=U5DJG3_9CHRO|nr:phosphate ABC transporter, permease protein PstA [Rubidibacter lacunae KORDI 51-2]